MNPKGSKIFPSIQHEPEDLFPFQLGATQVV